MRARPICTASPPGRPLTFIPLGLGVEAVVWTFPGGDSRELSTELTPEVNWAQPGQL